MERRRRRHAFSLAARPRRILVGYDGSEAAERALDAAAELMGYGTTIAVLSVEDGNGGAPSALDRARERLLGKHVTAVSQGAGDPADSLVAAAGELDADLVVVGARGAVRGPVLGSVSSDVVSRVDCDVLVVH